LLVSRRNRLKKLTGRSRSAVALSYPFRNCLGDTLEPFRLNAPENALKEEKIPNGPNGFGRFGIVDYSPQ
jgi:hypothetical protein